MVHRRLCPGRAVEASVGYRSKGEPDTRKPGRVSGRPCHHIFDRLPTQFPAVYRGTLPRALVTHPDRYEPELNRATAEFAHHYGTVILPARPRKPRDKAKVEVGVQIVERWILARLRHRQFFSVAELDAAIAELLPLLNERAFKKLPGCRKAIVGR